MNRFRRGNGLARRYLGFPIFLWSKNSSAALSGGGTAEDFSVVSKTETATQLVGRGLTRETVKVLRETN